MVQIQLTNVAVAGDTVTSTQREKLAVGDAATLFLKGIVAHTLNVAQGPASPEYYRMDGCIRVLWDEQLVGVPVDEVFGGIAPSCDSFRAVVAASK